MKLSVRKGVFETNSSSTHSLTMCSEDEFDQWKNGKLLYDSYNEELISKEEVFNIYRENEYYNDKTDDEIMDKIYEEREFLTFDQFASDEFLESYWDSYTTKSGEKVVAFGQFGYDC